MKNTVVKRSIGIALVATFIAFSAGMLLQWHIDQQRSFQVEEDITTLRLTTNSILTERELSAVFNQGDCVLDQERINERMEKLDRYGSKLEQFEERDVFSGTEYHRLKREYHLMQLFQWSKVVQVAEHCPGKEFVPVLFFYDEDCDSCEDQGLVLTGLKKRYGDKLQVFSIDVDMGQEEPAVSAVVDRFNITETPTIVIGLETVNTGFTGRNVLDAAIRRSLNNTIEDRGEEEG